jgi:Domain of unknown function (DUF4157)
VWQGLWVSHPGDQHERRADRAGPAAARGAPRIAPSPAAATGPLPDGLRAHFGRALGHKFDAVRVHSDHSADTMARRLAASAVTVGNDIYFRSGSYAPHTKDGLGLIGHELFHVMQQAGAARRIDRKTLTQEELEDITPPPSDPLAQPLGADSGLEKFAALMRQRYGTQTVKRGTFSDQSDEVDANRVTLLPGATRGHLDKAGWKEWSPPSGWATYRNILQGVRSFASGFGGLPKIDQVVFYNVAYEVGQDGLVRARPDIGADFGAGRLTIYGTVVKANDIPVGRSGVPYAGRQAELVPTTSEQAAVSRNVAHELGHGVGGTAVGPGKQGPDPNMYDDYRLVAGWTKYRAATATSPEAHEALYDSGVEEVRADLKDGKIPPEQYHITQYNWDEGQWIEQPVTQYTTKDPGEDFAEAIMAYLKFPDVLKARSPRRFKFIVDRKDKWLSGQKAQSPAIPMDRDTAPSINTPPQR